jgi:hypothetical protein
VPVRAPSNAFARTASEIVLTILRVHD